MDKLCHLCRWYSKQTIVFQQLNVHFFLRVDEAALLILKQNACFTYCSAEYFEKSSKNSVVEIRGATMFAD